MPGILCEHCTAVCCKYIALPLDTPTTESELDDIRWFLLHESVFVFVEQGDWYIAFATPCRHLQPDNRCGIYETRPQICRKYSTDNCDYHSGDYGWDHHFACAEHLDEYRRVHAHLYRQAREKPGRRKSAANRRRASVHAVMPSRKAAQRVSTVDLQGVPLPVLGMLATRNTPG